ncbi:MAG: dihydropteroate synthase [Eubacterium sp.]|nr:dihydropteroate synthase [Eubacterium sp.]
MRNQNNKVSIMGILNVTSDSFSDGGMYIDTDRAVSRAMEMISDGADIIDVGGESTRPGYEPVSAMEEKERVVPVISGIRTQNSTIKISIDTTKYEVAAAAIEAGATMINDISGLKKDVRLAELAEETGTDLIIIHNSGRILASSDLKSGVSADDCKSGEHNDSMAGDTSEYSCGEMNEVQEKFYIEGVCEELKESVETAKKSGVPAEKIILDPGVGFNKNYAQDICVIRNINRIAGLGYPVLMAASRKRVVGNTLGVPVQEREEGNIAVALYSVMHGCSMIRVHDVKSHARALRMWEGINR